LCVKGESTTEEGDRAFTSQSATQQQLNSSFTRRRKSRKSGCELFCTCGITKCTVYIAIFCNCSFSCGIISWFQRAATQQHDSWNVFLVGRHENDSTEQLLSAFREELEKDRDMTVRLFGQLIDAIKSKKW